MKGPLAIFRKISFSQKKYYRFLFFVSLFSGLVFGFAVSAVELRSSLALLKRYRPSTPTRLYDRNSKVFAELYRHRQELVSFHEIPPHIIHAFLAVEDLNFYNHIGIDFLGIMRAAIKNVLAGKIVQGGSTLTQQLSKQIYLNSEGHRERSFTQKIRETLLAFQIEEAISKEEILEYFFNVVYLGHGCRGLVCASRLYFNKKVSDLSLAEGALLARIPRSPVAYSPFKNPKRAMTVHLYVLNRMADADYLPANQVNELHLSFWKDYWPKIILRSSSQSAWGTRLDIAPHFTEYVRQILEATPEIEKDDIYSKSLKIYTTLDLDHQKIAQEEMENMRSTISKTALAYALQGGVSGVDFKLFEVMNTLRLLFKLPQPIIAKMTKKQIFQKTLEEGSLDGLQILNYLMPADNETEAFENFSFDTFHQNISASSKKLRVQQAFVSIQPQTGYITAMIGGSDFSPQNQFNRVLQARRQPGSAFKIFVYGSALEQRAISTMSPINDSPFLRTGSDGSSWSPENYDPGFRGSVTAKRALASSLNTSAVEVYYKTGPEAIIDFASRLMKIHNPRGRFHAEPTLALGASEITPMELSKAVAIIANGGREVIPFAIRYVTDGSDNLIYSQENEIRKAFVIRAREKKLQVIEPALAYILGKMLYYVSTSGTARYGLRSVGRGGFNGDIASKTGTTSNYSDAWITGFNPEYAATVWFGFDKSSVTLGPGQSGGGVGAPVIGSFFRRIYKSKDKPYPSFKEQAQWINVPKNVVKSKCNGLALGPRIINGKEQKLVEDDSCQGTRIYDERELLIQELGITPEELGVEAGKKVEFQR